MVPDPTKSSLGLEYFCSEGDALWKLPDAELVELGKRELDRIGLVSLADIQDGCVFRVPKAYPIYDSDYRDYLDTVKTFVCGLENYQTIGRNGLHRYNNQDHAMVTGMLSVRNLMFGEKNDLWTVNTDQEYHEEIRDAESGIALRAAKEALAEAFAKLDRVALGLSVGSMSGLMLFLTTLAVATGEEGRLAPYFQLLANFFPGYTVTGSGSLVGAAYGFMAGFISGWGLAFLRNIAVFLYAALMQQRAERTLLRKLLEYV